MRTIERSSVFKRDFKRVYATPRHRKDIEALLLDVVGHLVADEELPKAQRDPWSGGRLGWVSRVPHQAEPTFDI